MSEDAFIEAVERFKRMRARFDQRQVLKHEFELLVKFDEETYPLFGLYQQATVGNINVPRMSKEEAKLKYIETVQKLSENLENLVEKWKDDQDPKIPDELTTGSEAEKTERLRIIHEAKADRRRRHAIQRKEEEEKGMWDEPE